MVTLLCVVSIIWYLLIYRSIPTTSMYCTPEACTEFSRCRLKVTITKLRFSSLRQPWPFPLLAILILYIPFRIPALKTFPLMMSVPDKCYARKASCTLNYIFVIAITGSIPCQRTISPGWYHLPSSQCFGNDLVY